MIKKYLKALLISTFFSTTILAAALPEYNMPTLLARANVQDGYNLPALSFLNDTSPIINNRGDIAFKVLAVEGVNNQGLWVKQASESNGKIIYIAPEERFLSDPTSINDSGMIAFNLYDDGVTDGLFTINTNSKKVEQVLNPDDFPIQYYTYPQIKNNGHIIFRATDDNEERMFYDFEAGKLNKLIAEGVETSGLKSSYLFKPSANDSGAIAFKVRHGEKGQWDESNPDTIVVLSQSTDPLAPGVKLLTIAKDHDKDSHSEFLSFGNSLSLSKHGLVAFSAISLDSKKEIVIGSENSLKMIAKEGSGDLSEIETFAPKINDQGNVLFRAKDKEGKRALFLANESGVKKLIAEGDEVPTDYGPAKILSNPNYPGFAGEVDMNDSGEIVFHCIVISVNDNKELGSAIYKITPKK